MSTDAVSLPALAEGPPTKRRCMLPARFQQPYLALHDKRLLDILPQPVPQASLTPIPPQLDISSRVPVQPVEATAASTEGPVEGEVIASSDSLLVRKFVDTPRNVFGMFRRFHSSGFPAHDPECLVDLAVLTNTTIPPTTLASTDAACATISNSFQPYPNKSSFLLGDWFWNYGNQKSHENFKRLTTIIGSKDFSPEDIRKTNWAQINTQLGANQWDEGEWVDEDAGWCRSTIIFRVPFHRRTHVPGARDYAISNFYHRSLLSVIKEKLRSPHGIKHFHFEPYELRCNLSPASERSQPQPGSSSTECRLYGELYTSPAFMEAHQNLQKAPGEPGCHLPRVVVALMFWSDATHLTTFGNTKLWPLYMFFGNKSKYQRCKPSSHLCKHIAYFENVRNILEHYSSSVSEQTFQLPAAFKDFATKFIGEKKKLNTEFMAHCHCELTHEQWKVLLDDEFLHAYEHGEVVEASDCVSRRFYPRIFTYSTDYPEKYERQISTNDEHAEVISRILMVCIRNRGKCPCPRCKVPLSKTHLVGSKQD